jgi:hypothetical protein
MVQKVGPWPDLAALKLQLQAGLVPQRGCWKSSSWPTSICTSLGELIRCLGLLTARVLVFAPQNEKNGHMLGHSLENTALGGHTYDGLP